VIEEPWRDFAYNRTFALRKARERTAIDYSLMIDADQVVHFDPGFEFEKFKAGLMHDLYDVKIENGNVEYLMPHLTSNKVEISYRGVLHEFRVCPEDCSRGVAEGFLIRECHDGGRNQNERKYHDDAVLLEQALLVETDPFLIARYKFYLAQSYRDAGDKERSIKTYLERAGFGFWDEEVFYSLYAAAGMMGPAGYPEDEILETFLRAYRACPRRAEALHGAAYFCQSVGRYEQGYRLAKKALALPRPQQGLFIERWIYDYGLPDVYSVLAFHSGNYSECLDACARILREGLIPDDQRDRVRQNAHHAIERIEPSPDVMEVAGHGRHTPAVPSAAFPVPPEVKPNADMPPILEGVRSLSDKEPESASKCAEVLVESIPRETADAADKVNRNALCPCGSGKRYKHCHGAIG
jgi:SEC-C motif